MGNYFSSNNTQPANQLQKLENRLVDLEKLDRNNDGNVSREEMEIWMENQKKDIANLKEAIEQQLNKKYGKILAENDDYKQKIKELEKQVKSLENINDSLRKEVNMDRVDMLTPDEIKAKKVKLAELSSERINAVVEDLLNDKNVNINYLPDFVEKQIYRNVFSIMIGLLDNMMETTNIHFLGHKLTFDLSPEEAKEDKKKKHRKHKHHSHSSKEY